jgi:hypothetical protein
MLRGRASLAPFLTFSLCRNQHSHPDRQGINKEKAPGETFHQRLLSVAITYELWISNASRRCDHRRRDLRVAWLR